MSLADPSDGLPGEPLTVAQARSALSDYVNSLDWAVAAKKSDTDADEIHDLWIVSRDGYFILGFESRAGTDDAWVTINHAEAIDEMARQYVRDKIADGVVFRVITESGLYDPMDALQKL